MNFQTGLSKNEVIRQADVIVKPNKIAHLKVEETILLTMFPMEIWHVILDKVTKVEDMVNIANSSGLFYRHFQTYRVTYLFPDVLRIMDRHFCAASLFALTDMLNCRLASHNLLNTIDNFLVQEQQVTALRVKSHGKYGIFACRHTFQLPGKNITRHGSSSANRCLSFFKTRKDNPNGKKIYTVRCPFVGKTLKLVSCCVAQHLTLQENIYMHAVTDLVSKYGKDILCVELNWFNQNHDLSYSYYKFRKIIQKLPFVEFLSVKHGDGFGDTIKQNCAEFENYVRKYPFPRLQNLKYLKLLEISEPILRTILQNNVHITNLVIANAAYVESGIYQTLLPFLNELTINFTSRTQFCIAERCGISWKPNILRLSFNFINFKKENLPSQKIIHFINCNWSKSIVKLVLKLPKPNSETHKRELLNSSHFKRLELVQLKSFCLETWSPCSLDFLISCTKTLTRLQIIYHYVYFYLTSVSECQKTKDKQLIRFLGHESEMEKSNIWFEFNNLQKVLVSNSSRLYLNSKKSTGEITRIVLFNENGFLYECSDIF